MSQRTPARTTGATRKPSSRTSLAAVPEVAPTTGTPTLPDAPTPALAELRVGDVARVLRAVAHELEQDPELARRVASTLGEAFTTRGADAPAHVADASASDALRDAADGEAAPPVRVRRAPRGFQPRLITGTSPALGTGIPDPFAIRAELGEAGLRAALDELRLGSLRAIVREHKLDPSGTLAKQNDDEKLRALILRRTAKRRRLSTPNA